jgi:hypothetical protein
MAHYQLLIGPPGDGQSTLTYHALTPLKGKPWSDVKTACDVIKYVINLTDSKVQYNYKEENGLLVLSKGERTVVALDNCSDQLELTPGVPAMLMQFLTFALDNDDLKDYSHVQTMFAYFTGATFKDMQRMKEHASQALANLKQFYDCLAQVTPDVGMSIMDMNKHAFAEFSRQVNDALLKKDPQVAGDILKKREALERLCFIARLQAGFLQVYVRIRDGIVANVDNVASYNKLYDVTSCKSRNLFSVSKTDKKATLQLCGKDVGTYSDVFTKTSSNEVVANRLVGDMEQLRLGGSVVIFGYGYSGSGKTYSLMGTDTTDGALALALAKFAQTSPGVNRELKSVAVKRIYIEAISYAYEMSTNLKGITGTPRILFGTAHEWQGKTPDGDVELTFLNQMAKGQTLSLTPRKDDALILDSTEYSITPGSAESDVSNGVNALIRHVANAVSTYHKNHFRVRPTPNNVESSRVHTYYEFELTFAVHGAPKVVTSKLTVIDMAGLEEPEQILQEFNKEFLTSDVLTPISYSFSKNTKDKINTLHVEQNRTRTTDKRGTDKRGTDIDSDWKTDVNFNERPFNEKRNNAMKIGVDVAQVMANMALQPDVPYSDTLKTNYKSLVQTGPAAIGKANPFSGFKEDSTTTEDKYFNYYDSTMKAAITEKYGNWRAPLYYTNFHIAATVIEGCYIKASLDAMVEYFSQRTQKTPKPVDAVRYVFLQEQVGRKVFLQEQVGRKIMITQATSSLLNALDSPTNGMPPMFIMLAHVREDRPEGTKSTLDFAKKVSATLNFE